MGMATRVPNVPGAIGEYPAPNPDAIRRWKRFIPAGVNLVFLVSLVYLVNQRNKIDERDHMNLKDD
jgi:hypothetical protein